jgi:hypothetical protein
VVLWVPPQYPRTAPRPISDADPEDLQLLDDLLGITDPDTVVATIEADTRRRRLTALVNAASVTVASGSCT